MHLIHHTTLLHHNTITTTGLNVLAISRHGATEEQNKKIMFLETKSGGVKEVVKNSEKLREGGVVVRWVCVLQRGGVEDEGGVERYFDWVCDGAEGVETQVIFYFILFVFLFCLF